MNNLLKVVAMFCCFLGINAMTMAQKYKNLKYEKIEKIETKISAALADDVQEGLKLYHNYYNNGDKDLQFHLNATLWLNARASSDTAFRQKLVATMLNSVINTESNRQHTLRFLLHFSPIDFDTNARKQLESVSLSDNDFIKLIGVAQVTSRTKELIAIKNSNLNPDPWLATLALARMGDGEALDSIIAKVRNTEDMIDVAGLLYDLGYTKQQKAFDVMREYLRSSAYLPSTKDHSKPGLPIAYYASLQFARYVSDCPIKKDYFMAEEIETIEQWAEKQQVWQFE